MINTAEVIKRFAEKGIELNIKMYHIDRDGGFDRFEISASKLGVTIANHRDGLQNFISDFDDLTAWVENYNWSAQLDRSRKSQNWIVSQNGVLHDEYPGVSRCQYEFIGFGDTPSQHGVAALTIGKIYDASYVDGDEYEGSLPSLYILVDDAGKGALWEELRGFKEVK